MTALAEPRRRAARIAVVGSGISGLVAARLLARDHEVVVLEAGDHVGGHTHTHEVEVAGERHAVDTGFIVFNDRTYPNFVRLLGELGVASQESDMSFSVRCERTGLLYNGTSLDALFCQRRNLVRPSFLRMVADILRFNRRAPELLETEDDELTLGEYLDRGRYSRAFVEHYAIPMGAAVWSATQQAMLRFPARCFVRFFANHGFLSVDDRPVWRVVRGGSARYVEALTRPFAGRIRLRTPVLSVRRGEDGVTIRTPSGEERFDHVVIAAHSDQALAMLADPSEAERAVLGAIAYQENEAVLHTDASLLPPTRLSRASWNYHLGAEGDGRVAVTYFMNLLQRLPTATPFCVTLNRTGAIDPAKVLRRVTYHHPVFTSAALAAQRRHAEICGVRRTSYCGAYWGFGFHEDGVKSALAAVERAQRSLTATRAAPAGVLA